MRHQVVRTRDEWSSLRGDWNKLLRRSRGDAVFMTWQWLDTWLRVHDRVVDLLVVCVRDETNGELKGVAPYYKTDYALRGIVPYRVLRPIGDIDSGAEYQTWVVEQSNEVDVSGELAAALDELGSEWDLIWMPKLSGWSETHESLLAALRGRFRVNCRPSVFSAFSLPDAFDEYLRRMSANRRQQVRRTSKKILSQPGVEVRKVATAEELEPALAALFELHGKRWRQVGEQGVFARNPVEKEFYEQFVPHALAEGWLALYTLLDDGEIKAAQIGYVYGGAFLQLQEGFDPDYSPNVGNALRAFVIEDCIKERLREYDFLGGRSEHKRRWLGEERLGMDLLAANARLKNLPIMRFGVWPTGAYLRPRAAAVRR